MKISVAYILKNEEKNIEKSILSCKNAVDEIIVYDTGSTDNTVEICKNLGATVYEGTWENDFAKARNFALSKCTGDYILILDADEYFDTELKENELKEKISSVDIDEEVDVFAIKCRDVDMNTQKIHYELYACKVLKNHRNLRYISPIHEYVVGENNRRVCMIPLEGFTIIHSGYTALRETNKIQRNIDILEGIEDKMPMHYFYLAREYLALKQIDKVEENIAKFFESDGYKDFVEHSNIGIDPYFIQLFVLRKHNEHDKVVALLEQMRKQFPNNAKVYYEYGNQFFGKDKKKAKEMYLKSIEVNYKMQGKDTEINTFKSFESNLYFMLSSCCFFLGELQAAISHGIVSCMLDKKNSGYLVQLSLLLSEDNYKHNIEALTKIYLPKTKEDYEFLVKALYNTHLKREFCYFSEIYNRQFNGNRPEVYYAMGMTGYVCDAIGILNELKNPACSFLYVTLSILSQNPEYLQNVPEWVEKGYDKVIRYFIGEEVELTPTDYDLFGKIYCCVVLNSPDLLQPAFIEDIVDHCTDSVIESLIKNMVTNHQSQWLKFTVDKLQNTITVVDTIKINDTIKSLEIMKQVNKNNAKTK